MSDVSLVRLGDCCEIVSGATPKTGVREYWGGDIAWATPKDLSNIDSKYIAAPPQTLTEAGYRSCSAKIMPAGSVLFSSRAPIGHVAINKVPMCTNQGFKSFVPDPERVSPDYLYHWLRANKTYLQSLGNGATFKEVSKATIEEVKISLPVLAEQRRIAAILDKADALRAKRRKTIAKLKQLERSVFYGMFGEQEVEIQRWPVVTLDSLASLITKGTTPTTLGFPFVATGTPLLRVQNLSDLQVHLDDVLFIDPATNEALGRSKIQSSDVLISIAGTIGRVALVAADLPPMNCNQAIAIIRPTEEIEPLFLLNWLQSRSALAQIAAGRVTGTISNLSLGLIRSLKLPVPPMGLQREFSAQVLAIRTLVQQAQRQRETGDQLLQSLQHHAFAGTL